MTQFIRFFVICQEFSLNFMPPKGGFLFYHDLPFAVPPSEFRTAKLPTASVLSAACANRINNLAPFLPLRRAGSPFLSQKGRKRFETNGFICKMSQKTAGSEEPATFQQYPSFYILFTEPLLKRLAQIGFALVNPFRKICRILLAGLSYF